MDLKLEACKKMRAYHTLTLNTSKRHILLTHCQIRESEKST